jgi:2-polyprenyl-3-methyl-5-hydroxy-6-metoxy-1,4-benzoquinol methylase
MNFEYKEIDKEGLTVLAAISSADKFNRWMYETIAPFCSGSILEIGSGVGNISQYFILKGSPICLSDIRENYRDIIKEKFKLDDSRVIDIDIIHPDFGVVYKDLLAKFDSIFCLNVIEHIQDDSLAIENMMKLLKADGKLIVLVPAFQCLYNGIDSTLEHYRRYSKKALINVMAKHGLVIKSFYFNSVGILAWFIGGSILRNKTIQEGKMSLFNFFVPIYKLIDRLLLRKIGLSIVCVIQKKS